MSGRFAEILKAFIFNIVHSLSRCIDCSWCYLRFHYCFYVFICSAEHCLAHPLPPSVSLNSSQPLKIIGSRYLTFRPFRVLMSQFVLVRNFCVRSFPGLGSLFASVNSSGELRTEKRTMPLWRQGPHEFFCACAGYVWNSCIPEPGHRWLEINVLKKSSYQDRMEKDWPCYRCGILK